MLDEKTDGVSPAVETSQKAINADAGPPMTWRQKRAQIGAAFLRVLRRVPQRIWRENQMWVVILLLSIIWLAAEGVLWVMRAVGL